MRMPVLSRRSILQQGLRAGMGLATTVAARKVANAAPAPWPVEEGLTIIDVRLVKTRPKNSFPQYDPTPGSYWATREAARPIEMHPEYTGKRGPGSKWMPDRSLGGVTVEISTNKGLKGYGRGGSAAGPFVEPALKKLLIGKNPLDTEKLWDVMWRATLFYGRAGAVVHAISGVDLALWDLAGKAFGVPVYKLLGGRTWERVPCYATGNDVEQSLEFGYKKVKLALQYGPADGRDGLKKNVEHVKRTRELLGPDGELMIDCWMALTEGYTIQLAEALEPYRVYWLEEVLMPDGVRGLRAAELSDHLDLLGHRRARVHALRLRPSGALQGCRYLAARHQLVRRPERDAQDRRHGARARHPSNPSCGRFC